MKIFILLFVGLLSFNSLIAQNNPDSLIRKLKVSEETVMQNDRQAGYIKFDINGDIIYHKYDDFIGGPISTSSTKIYDKNHKILQSKSTHSSSQKDTTIWNYQYDQAGNLTSITDKNGHSVFNYNYDLRGEKTKESMPDTLGNIISEKTYEYDKYGNETAEHLNYKNMVNRLNKTYYDSLNRKIRTESIENNAIRFADTYFYDVYTNLLVKELYDEDGSGKRLDGVLYKYDNKTRLVKRLHFNLLTNGEEAITGEEMFQYFDNDLIKSYTENIQSFNHQNRTFVYSYKMLH